MAASVTSSVTSDENDPFSVYASPQCRPLTDVFNMADFDRKQRDAEMKNAINKKLTENFERERLLELLRTRLRECGWRDKLTQECKDIIKEKGLDKVTVDDLVTEITPKARELVPDEVKRELLERIRSYFGDNV